MHEKGRDACACWRVYAIVYVCASDGQVRKEQDKGQCVDQEKWETCERGG